MQVVCRPPGRASTQAKAVAGKFVGQSLQYDALATNGAGVCCKNRLNIGRSWSSYHRRSLGMLSRLNHKSLPY